MANTLFNTNLEVSRWRNELYTQAKKDTYFSRFFKMKFGYELGHQGADWAHLLPNFHRTLGLHYGKVWAPRAAQRRPNIAKHKIQSYTKTNWSNRKIHQKKIGE